MTKYFMFLSLLCFHTYVFVSNNNDDDALQQQDSGDSSATRPRLQHSGPSYRNLSKALNVSHGSQSSGSASSALSQASLNSFRRDAVVVETQDDEQNNNGQKSLILLAAAKHEEKQQQRANNLTVSSSSSSDGSDLIPDNSSTIKFNDEFVKAFSDATKTVDEEKTVKGVPHYLDPNLFDTRHGQFPVISDMQGTQAPVNSPITQQPAQSAGGGAASDTSGQ